jgi:amino acid transporter
LPRNGADRQAPPRAEVIAARPGGLGTFGGVFTPSILTILGVIMYLRFGWVVGNVGLAQTLLIVTLSTSITFITALSVAAIATDQQVRIGGAYYMISRSLGIETGGAVGVPLFFAQALSVALYTVGFAESVVQAFPGLSVRWVGIAVTLGVAVLALTSARVAIRAQYVIMGAIGLSLLSLLAGSPLDGAEVQGFAGGSGDVGFWTVFAVFFPAVTGIMAGVNMSGDLKDPGESIPRGTFAAIGTGYLIYMLLPVLLVLRADTATLVSDPLVMRRIAIWGDAILLGVWGATLSSAVGSILGAPRVLQALARDGVLPGGFQWLGKGAGPEDEPRNGTILTLGIALVAVWFGDLNLIAPILTMFFLTTYGVLNVAAGVERFLGSPSFRPRFRVPWYVSLLGATGCLAVMVLVNMPATIVAVVVVGAVYIWLERRGLKATWGDVRGGLWMAMTRAGLLRHRTEADPKNWRPHLLVLSGAPKRRWHLIDLASSISHSRGLLNVATVVPREAMTAQRQSSLEGSIREYLDRRGVQSLVRVISADDAFQGAELLVDAYGLGALHPNTVLLGDSENEESRRRYAQMVGHFHANQRNVVIVHEGAAHTFGDRERIHIWWGGLRGNGSLMLIFAYLLRTSLRWRNAEVRLKMVVDDEAAAEGVRDNLDQILERSRTGARADVLTADGRPFSEILRSESADADLVMMGMAEPDDAFGDYLRRINEWTRDMDATTIFVLASEGIAFREVLFASDDG